MTLARDVSNYSVPLTAELLAQWRAVGIGLVLCQAFPPNYKQYVQQTAQARAVLAAGLQLDFYVYSYLADPAWRDGAVSGLETLAAQGIVARRLWADEEDVSGNAKALSPTRRVAAIRADLQALDLAPSRLGLSGIYTGAWYWQPYTGNYQGFSDRPLWVAQYDSVANPSVFAPFAGWTHASIKQFAGSQPDGTDLDVLSAEEVGTFPKPEVANVAIVVGQGMQTQMAAAGDAPLFSHKFYAEVDDQGHSYDVEECYGSRGRYVSSNSNGGWINAGPF